MLTQMVFNSLGHAAIFAVGAFGVGELMVIGVIAVVLFGKRLPEVARSLGQSYTQFRRGLTDIRSELDISAYTDPHASPPSYMTDNEDQDDDRDIPTAPKFEPPPSEPKRIS